MSGEHKHDTHTRTHTKTTKATDERTRTQHTPTHTYTHTNTHDREACISIVKDPMENNEDFTKLTKRHEFSDCCIFATRFKSGRGAGAMRPHRDGEGLVHIMMPLDHIDTDTRKMGPCEIIRDSGKRTQHTHTHQPHTTPRNTTHTITTDNIFSCAVKLKDDATKQDKDTLKMRAPGNAAPYPRKLVRTQHKSTRTNTHHSPHTNAAQEERSAWEWMHEKMVVDGEPGTVYFLGGKVWHYVHGKACTQRTHLMCTH